MDPAKIREAMAVLAAAVEESEGARITWDRLWELYSANPPVKDSTFTSYSALWYSRVGPHFGEMDVLGTTSVDVAKYRDKRRGEKTQRGNDTKPASRNREVMLLRTLSTWATKRGHVQRNPLMALDDHEEENNIRETVVSEPMLRSVLPWMPPVVVAFVVTVLDSGLRRAEAAGLRWDQVDLDHGVIELSRTQTKGNRARITMLSARAATLLRNLPKIGIYVFANPETGSHYQPNWFLTKWRYACDCTGIQGPDGNITLHDLRRTFATRGRRAGIQETELMAMGGWRSAEVFMRYNVVGLDDIADARKRAEAYLRKTERIAPKKIPKQELTSEDQSGFLNDARTEE
jgi:integrase